MQLLNPATSNASVNSHVQQQIQNPILKGFNSFLAKLAIVKSSVSMLFGDYSLQTVGDLTYGLLATPAYDLVAHHLNQDPDCAALIRDRYIPPAHDLETLLTLPPIL